MCNAGKFIDRSPTLNPAGQDTYNKGESVGRCLVDPNTEYTNDKLKKPGKMKAYPFPPLRDDPHAGFLTKMRSLLQAPPKSIFQGLLEEFQETRYDSYWNKRLGRGRDFVPGLPPAIDPETTCFGIHTDTGNNVGELLNPKKPAWQIITESEIGHDLYRKSHNDYYPGEQTDRNYDRPKLNKDLVYGEIIPHNKAGDLVKGAMKWQKKFPVGDIQKNFTENSYRHIGKSYTPNKNIEKVPIGYRFGKTSSDKSTVADSLRLCSFNAEKTELIDVLGIINALRLLLERRSPRFPYRDLLATFQFRDKALSGLLGFESVYEVLLLFQIIISRKTLEIICKRMNIIHIDGLIDYNKLIDIINYNSSLPTFKKIQDVPDELLLYKSEYQDHYDQTNKEKGIKSKICNDDTVSGANNAHESITPSIYTQYGLSCDDFLKVYSKEAIKKIFKNICIQIPEEKFHMVWELASKKDEYGRVSLNTFKEELKAQVPELLIAF